MQSCFFLFYSILFYLFFRIAHSASGLPPPSQMLDSPGKCLSMCVCVLISATFASCCRWLWLGVCRAASSELCGPWCAQSTFGHRTVLSGPQCYCKSVQRATFQRSSIVVVNAGRFDKIRRINHTPRGPDVRRGSTAKTNIMKICEITKKSAKKQQQTTIYEASR